MKDFYEKFVLVRMEDFMLSKCTLFGGKVTSKG